jgi:hypothetical protein
MHPAPKIFGKHHFVLKDMNHTADKANVLYKAPNMRSTAMPHCVAVFNVNSLTGLIAPDEDNPHRFTHQPWCEGKQFTFPIDPAIAFQAAQKNQEWWRAS